MGQGTYEVDNTDPTCSSISITNKTTSGFTASVTASDSYTEIKKVTFDFTSNGITKSYTTSYSTPTASCTPSASIVRSDFGGSYGPYTVTVTAYDYANNSRSVTMTGIELDTTAPSIAFTTAVKSNYAIITTDISDTESGGVIQKYASGSQTTSYFNSSGSEIKNNTINVTVNGVYTIYARDVLGNATVKTVTITIPNQALSIPTFSVSPSGFTNSNKIITITYPSSATVKQYSINNGGYINYTDAISVSSNCVLTARAVNAVGIDSISSYTISDIDTLAPNSPSIYENSNGTVNIIHNGDSPSSSIALSNLSGFSAFTSTYNNWSSSTARYFGGESGNTSYSSGSQSGEMTINITVPSNAINPIFSCYYSVSSEDNYDFLRIKIDGTEIMKTSGEVDWSYFRYTVTPGNHTVTFEYYKDGSVNKYLDQCFIDLPKLSYCIPSSGQASGINSLEYRIGDTGTWTSCTSSISPDRTSSYILFVRVRDLAGNYSSISQRKLEKIQFKPINADAYFSENATRQITSPNECHEYTFTVGSGSGFIQNRETQILLQKATSLSGLTLQLLDSSNSVIQTITLHTNSNSEAISKCEGLSSGTYKIRITAPSQLNSLFAYNLIVSAVN